MHRNREIEDGEFNYEIDADLPEVQVRQDRQYQRTSVCWHRSAITPWRTPNK